MPHGLIFVQVEIETLNVQKQKLEEHIRLVAGGCWEAIKCTLLATISNGNTISSKSFPCSEICEKLNELTEDESNQRLYFLFVAMLTCIV